MTQSLQPPSSLQSSEVHLYDYVRVIMRRRMSFLLTFCAVFFGVAIYTYTMKPLYEASATLHVRDDRGGKGNFFSELGMAKQNPIDAEIEILKSRTNAEQVVNRMHLNWRVTKKSRGVSFRMSEFTTTSPNDEYRVVLTGADGYTLFDKNEKQLGAGRSGVLFQSGELRLLLWDVKGKQGDSFRISLTPLHLVANGLKSRVKAAEVGSRTSIIRLSYCDHDPVSARDVVNTLADVYLEQSVAFKTQEAGKSVNFIENQLNSVRADLDTAEKNLQEYKTGTGVLKLDIEADELVRKISEIEKERTALAIQKQQVDLSLAAQRDALKRGVVYTPLTFKDDLGVGNMTARLAELEVQKRGLFTELTDSHPQVRAIQGQIDEIQKKLLSTYENKQKNHATQEAALKQTLARYDGALKQLPVAERDLARLMRHTKVNADIYTFLLKKHEETRIVMASTISNINVIDPAITPQVPIKPNKKNNLLLGFFVALMLGIGLAFFQEYLDDTIKDPDSAQRELGSPVLAVIPFIARKEGGANDRRGSLITQLEPKSAVSEAFRALRTSLHFSAINREKKVILMTSTFSGEGKSTVISNLAVTLVQAGARVLLLDGDMRRPSLHEIFGHSKLPGLSEILAGDTSYETVLHNTGIEGLDLISAGTVPPNPSELLGSEQMSNLLAILRDRYDHVLIDAPPVLAVTDAPLLTSRCDVVLLTIETERVPVKAGRRMAEMLANIQAPVAGIVVNDKADHNRERYGYYGNYYGYGYYGEDSSSSKRVHWLGRFLRKMG